MFITSIFKELVQRKNKIMLYQTNQDLPSEIRDRHDQAAQDPPPADLG